MAYSKRMVRLIEQGQYILLETHSQTKILIFEHTKSYAWINAGDIGEILVTSHKSHVADHILSVGNYRVYEIKDEKNITDQVHLELHVGSGKWQGYLLPTGFPNDKKKRTRIIPTKEVITQAKAFLF